MECASREVAYRLTRSPGESLKSSRAMVAEPEAVFSPLLFRSETVFSASRSEEHTSELQSLRHLVCRLLLEKKQHTIFIFHVTRALCTAGRPLGAYGRD